jgi:CheY-like chemotaxis protein
VTLRLASVGEPPAESEYLSGKSILMVNDHDQLSGELLLLLRRWDIRAIRVPDYISAVTSVRNSEHPFDLVLVEATLGSRDGVEVGGRLRDSGMEAKMVLMYHAAIRNVPTHAITRGFDILEAKPALLNDYEYLFERAFGEKGDGDDSREQGVSYHPVPERSLSILVVEDNSVNQMVIRGLLSKLHHCATLCENGQDAVSVLQDSPDGFDVVLMDCEMPVMDGLTATRLLRDWENSVGHAHIPVIALTAHILKEQLDACRDAGMDDLLTKPIEIKKLEEILLRHVSS